MPSIISRIPGKPRKILEYRGSSIIFLRYLEKRAAVSSIVSLCFTTTLLTDVTGILDWIRGKTSLSEYPSVTRIRLSGLNFSKASLSSEINFLSAAMPPSSEPAIVAT